MRSILMLVILNVYHAVMLNVCFRVKNGIILIKVYCNTFITTLLFFVLPSAVALSATGNDDP
jgi:hypothetical protein